MYLTITTRTLVEYLPHREFKWLREFFLLLSSPLTKFYRKSPIFQKRIKLSEFCKMDVKLQLKFFSQNSNYCLMNE